MNAAQVRWLVRWGIRITYPIIITIQLSMGRWWPAIGLAAIWAFIEWSMSRTDRFLAESQARMQFIHGLAVGDVKGHCDFCDEEVTLPDFPHHVRLFHPDEFERWTANAR